MKKILKNITNIKKKYVYIAFFAIVLLMFFSFVVGQPSFSKSQATKTVAKTSAKNQMGNNALNNNDKLEDNVDDQNDITASADSSTEDSATEDEINPSDIPKTKEELIAYELEIAQQYQSQIAAYQANGLSASDLNKQQITNIYKDSRKIQPLVDVIPGRKPDDLPETLERYSKKKFARGLGFALLRFAFDTAKTIFKYSAIIVLISELFEALSSLFQFLLLAFPNLITGVYSQTNGIGLVGLTIQMIGYISFGLLFVAFLLVEIVNRIKMQKSEKKVEQYYKILIGIGLIFVLPIFLSLLVSLYVMLSDVLVGELNNIFTNYNIDSVSAYYEFQMLNASYIGAEADRVATIQNTLNEGISTIYDVSTGDNFFAQSIGSILIFTLAVIDYMYIILWNMATGSFLGFVFGIIGMAVLAPVFVVVSLLSLVMGVDISEITDVVNEEMFMYNPLLLTISLIVGIIVMAKLGFSIFKYVFEMILIYIFLPLTIFSFVYGEGQIVKQLFKRFVGILITMILIIAITIIGAMVLLEINSLVLSMGMSSDQRIYHVLYFILSLMLLWNTANVSEKFVQMIGLDGGFGNEQSMLSNPYIWMSVAR